MHGTTCYLNSVNPIVGAVLFGGTLSSPEQSTVQVKSVIRYEGYSKVIISSNHPHSDSPCLLEVSSLITGKRKILPLQGKILLLRITIMICSMTSTNCACVHTCVSLLTHN